MMIENYAPGEYISAWCTKCRMELGHTIVAMVQNAPKRVRCNTCNGEHNYRIGPSDRIRTGSTNLKRKTRKPEAGYHELMSRLSGDRPPRVRKYSTRENFEKNDVLEHPRFGVGVVATVIHRNKIEVFFKDGLKLLAQNM